jgi:hypothetical protein
MRGGVIDAEPSVVEGIRAAVLAEAGATLIAAKGSRGRKVKTWTMEVSRPQ